MGLKNTVNLKPIHAKDRSQSELSFPNLICKIMALEEKKEIFGVVLSVLPGEEVAV